MKALDAIYQVLQEAGEPLETQHIARTIIDRGLWKSDGKNPEGSIRTVLAVDIQKRGKQSRFRRINRGVFGLTEWAESHTNGLEEVAIVEPLSTLEEQVYKPEPVELVVEPPVETKKSVTEKGSKQTDQSSTQTLSFSDAAEKVLHRFADREPMHYREITRRAMELGYLESSSETPEVVMYSVIAGENQRRIKRG